MYAFVDDGSEPLYNGVNWDMVRVLPGPLALLALAAWRSLPARPSSRVDLPSGSIRVVVGQSHR